ncbi:hypothetical protein GCM10023335_14090 [Streptomyces siamensis]|uniref:Uncharacterized protein n=1 Tax=Streptomyces siamensis TaxID=1274986 RepID=A0ABP9IL60_9ACTN
MQIGERATALADGGAYSFDDHGFGGHWGWVLSSVTRAARASRPTRHAELVRVLVLCAVC